MSAKLYEDIGYHGGIHAITFVGNQLKILTRGSMGEPKMWNLSKTAYRRAKWKKIWNPGSYSAHMEGTFDARFLDLRLGSFGALCKISNFTTFKTLLLS